MKSKLFLFLFIIFVILLMGCESAEKNFTPKKMAQRKLLEELSHCESKFGTDSASKREANVDYCYRVLGFVESLVVSGYFESYDGSDQIITQAKNITLTPERTTVEVEAYSNLDKTINDIIGDI